MASNAAPTYNRRRVQRRALQSLGAVEKRPTAGHNVSHSHRKTKRLFKPNLQKAKVVVDGRLVSVRVDAKTLRSLTKAVKERPDRPKRKPRVSATKKAAPRAAAKKPAAKKS